MVGATVSHYRVLSTLGRGGMGIVYAAEDTKLHRKVALKFIEGSDPGSEARLVREAQAACTLDHPNIATVYEIGEWNGRPFIAMAYYEGQTLKDRIAAGPIPAADARRMAFEIASGLAAAHAAGIVHRDLKPGNILITDSGHVKILDFGLAKQLTAPETDTATQLTAAGTTLGTLAYMAPEQTAGAATNSAADIWSFGVVLYELLTRRRPFEGPTPAATLMAIVSGEPARIESLSPDVPPDLCEITRRALVKAPERRTITAAEIARALEPSAPAMPAAALRRWSGGTKVAVGAMVVAIAAATIWGYLQYSRIRWATDVAIPEARRLAGQADYFGAFVIARRARETVPNNADLAELWSDITRRVSVTSSPEGADISVAPVGGTAWIPLGRSPLNDIVIPLGSLRYKAEKPGLRTAEDLSVFFPPSLILSDDSSRPPGMVRAGAAPRGSQLYLFPGADPVAIEYPELWIDQTEVTNRAFKAFIDAGGYRRREFWTVPFVRGTTSLTWDQAMALLVDTTGRPGPATWEGGIYPSGQDDYPVRGVNWYEAAAYAAYAGKQLPTIVHWRSISGPQSLGDVIPRANLAGTGPHPAGPQAAPARSGTLDLIGNVKEWVANSGGGNLRFTMGGAWDEQPYMAWEPDARDAFERAANFGFRCARFDPGDRSPITLGGNYERPARDFTTETPVDDTIFDAYRRFYAYDHTAVKAAVRARDESAADWVLESVTFPAPYGGETVAARVYIPKRGTPPYQAVIFITGAAQFVLRTPGDMELRFAAPMVRAGRLVIAPVLKGAYERHTPEFNSDTTKSSTLWRDYVVAWHKDIARTIDYLQTRPDVDSERIGFMGYSRGAAMIPITLAQEPRIKTAALVIPGFYLARPAPEVDVFNFTPRVTQPILMLSGKFDSIFPERSQLPFFDTLGTSADRKRRVVYDTGHSLIPEMIKETLAWFDRYLGPVRAQ
jgi:dienelactone hydrolase/tRNA A-37 threonylcarbamoyl transferase component Bud32